jgi:hypothetical protein
MSSDAMRIAEMKRWRLEKRDAGGEIFEIVEGGGGRAPRVVFRRPGEPAESYAKLPHEQPEED